MDSMTEIKDTAKGIDCKESPFIEEAKIDHIEMDTGCVNIRIGVAERFYYEMLSELTGTKIDGQYDLIAQMKKLSALKREYENVKDAFDSVRMRGYGVVSPKKEEIIMDEPEVIKQGNKYGVKIKAAAPSIHMMKADITTEISPIVGSEKQSQELVMYLLQEFEDSPEKIWESNIFGKSLHSLVNEGLHNKLYRMPLDARSKLQETLERIINEGCSGLICIIL